MQPLFRIARVLCIVLLLVAVSSAQRRGFPQPPAPATTEQAQPEPRAPRRMDTVEMEREAKELAQLADAIPGDVEQLKQGLLPKGTVEKLKRIEKLSKQLRAQIQH